MKKSLAVLALALSTAVALNASALGSKTGIIVGLRGGGGGKMLNPQPLPPGLQK